jgi:hypothetical protein
MIVMAFDLSSVCIGITTAEMDLYGNIKVMRSCPIIPKEFNPETLGYMKSKKKLPTRNGELINTYWRRGETSISKVEKKRRDNEVRAQKDIRMLQEISKSMNDLVTAIKPDRIVAEKNEIFNGILTSVLLGKVMGTLVSITGINGIVFEEIKVTEARSIFDIPKILNQFRSGHTDKELMIVPDVTKRALREEMERLYSQYGIRFQTDDESDSCVVFHYWYNKRYM